MTYDRCKHDPLGQIDGCPECDEALSIRCTSCGILSLKYIGPKLNQQPFCANSTDWKSLVEGYIVKGGMRVVCPNCGNPIGALVGDKYFEMVAWSDEPDPEQIRRKSMRDNIIGAAILLIIVIGCILALSGCANQGDEYVRETTISGAASIIRGGAKTHMVTISDGLSKKDVDITLSDGKLTVKIKDASNE